MDINHTRCSNIKCFNLCEDNTYKANGIITQAGKGDVGTDGITDYSTDAYPWW